MCQDCDVSGSNKKWWDVTSSTCKDSTARDNCGTYVDFADGCLTCSDGYFRTSATQCEAITKVENCAIYSSKTDCLMCAEGYFRESATKCTAMTVDNCATGTAANVCVSCKDEYGLKSATECVKIPESCEPGQYNSVAGKCKRCNFYSSYYTTDVVARIGSVGTDYEQTCAKKTASGS